MNNVRILILLTSTRIRVLCGNQHIHTDTYVGVCVCLDNKVIIHTQMFLLLLLLFG